MRVSGISNYQYNKQNFGIGYPVASDFLGVPYSLTNKLLKSNNEGTFERLARIGREWSENNLREELLKESQIKEAFSQDWNYSVPELKLPVLTRVSKAVKEFLSGDSIGYFPDIEI